MAEPTETTSSAPAGSEPAGVPAAALARLDRRALLLLRTRWHHPTVERVAQRLSDFGEWGLGWAALGALGAARERDPRRRRAWLAAAVAGPAAVGVNYAVKLAVRRPRPELEGYPQLAHQTSKHSFPSAHATSSLAAATAIGRLAPHARPGARGLAAAICFGRPYLGMHYPSDVLAGVALGSAVGRLWPLPGSRPRRELWAG